MYTTDTAAIIPLIVSLVQVAKMCGLESRWSAALAVGLGILFSVLYWVAKQTLSASMGYDAIITGIIAGLSAAGLYSGVSAMVRPTLEPAPAPEPPVVPKAPKPKVPLKG